MKNENEFFVNKVIPNRNIIPKTYTVTKKTDKDMGSNDKMYFGDKTTEITENTIYKGKTVKYKGVLKNELIIPPFTEINTFIIPEFNCHTLFDERKRNHGIQ